jgi:nicotinic acid mononucleotide adenylyltransferase
VNVAVQTNRQTMSYYIKLGKPRNRMLEEMVLEDCLYRIFLTATVGADIPNKDELRLNALEGDDSLDWEVGRLQDYPDLTAGDICDVVHGREATTCGKYMPKAVFSTSLNPIHEGHLAVIDRAAQELGCPVDVELCISNADKPSLDYISIGKRIGLSLVVLSGRPSFGRIIVSNRPTYFEKSDAYPGATFIVGDDTIARIALPKYYKGTGDYLEGLETLARNSNRFLVFPREHDIVPRPSYWLRLNSFVTKVKDFNHMNISSSQLRKEKSNV